MFVIFCASLQFLYFAVQQAIHAPWSPSISDWQTKLRCGGGRRRLGIGKDSANDVGADGSGGNGGWGRCYCQHKQCLLRGRAGCDRGRRRFIQQTQKMGEKCDERAYQHGWFSSQQPFPKQIRGIYSPSVRLLPVHFFCRSCAKQSVIKNSSQSWS